MYLPPINNIAKDREMINTFYGYNHNLVTGQGQFYEMHNMTSDYFPVLSPRGKRAINKNITKANGMMSADELAYVDGTKLHYAGTEVCEVTDNEKTLVRIGAYLCIFPDKLIYNTNTNTCENMESHYTQKGTKIVITPCTLDGASCDVAQSKPANPSDGDYWNDNGTLKQWSATYNMWTSIPTSYMKIIDFENEITGFKTGDTVTIAGISENIDSDYLIYGVSEGALIISSGEYGTYEVTGMTIDRNVPDMDYVCEHNNRLWGCSSKNHEIYSCKLGDPTNWRCYTGLVNDSYAVTVGTPGEFTGCTSYGGYVLFFKENYIHRLYGTQPSDYRLNETECRGVQKGSERSLCTINEILYYKSKHGIVRYDGSLPVSISDVFGSEMYKNARGGTGNGKYMVSMQDLKDDWHLFVYDIQKGIWCREDELKVNYFANYENSLYMMTDSQLIVANPEYTANNIYPGITILKDGEISELYPGLFYPGQIIEEINENDISWSCETGDLTMEYPDHKYVSKIILRLSVDIGSVFEMYIQYDSDGVWEKILDINGTRKRSISIPVRILRCDHIKIKFCGTGNCKVYSMTYEIERGSEL